MTTFDWIPNARSALDFRYRYCRSCHRHGVGYEHRQVSVGTFKRYDGTTGEWPMYEVFCLECEQPTVVFWDPHNATSQWRDLTESKHNGTERFYGNAEQIFKLCCAIGKAPSAIKIAMHNGLVFSPTRDIYCVDVGPRHIVQAQALMQSALPERTT